MFQTQVAPLFLSVLIITNMTLELINTFRQVIHQGTLVVMLQMWYKTDLMTGQTADQIKNFKVASENFFPFFRQSKRARPQPQNFSSHTSEALDKTERRMTTSSVVRCQRAYLNSFPSAKSGKLWPNSGLEADTGICCASSSAPMPHESTSWCQPEICTGNLHW